MKILQKIFEQDGRGQGRRHSGWRGQRQLVQRCGGLSCLCGRGERRVHPSFAPNDPITREQLVTVRYRYAQLLAMDTDVTTSRTEAAVVIDHFLKMV